ncbi:hypothetical protein EB837_12335 [Kluyvera ascorbata]|uniref:Uncharacterized protein n=1 Tax=Kluyvera ascorbata TaxID=51288 RepID=A0A3N2S1W5_9ENTR|nr:hypothetical protein EB837_12335 [Kluyvera ascorbata]
MVSLVYLGIETKCSLSLSIERCGRNQFAKRMGASLITDDGEALEGEALDDVSILGVVTHLINEVARPDDDEMPVI